MVWTCQFVYLFTFGRTFGFFSQFLFNNNRVAISIFYTDFCANTDFISLEKISKCEIADSYARFFFSFFLSFFF